MPPPRMVTAQPQQRRGRDLYAVAPIPHLYRKRIGQRAHPFADRIGAHRAAIGQVCDRGIGKTQRRGGIAVDVRDHI
jgi:hypothetical protein